MGIGIALIFLGHYKVSPGRDNTKANTINNWTVVGIFVITVLNVLIAAFTIDHTAGIGQKNTINQQQTTSLWSTKNQENLGAGVNNKRFLLNQLCCLLAIFCAFSSEALAAYLTETVKYEQILQGAIGMTDG